MKWNWQLSGWKSFAYKVDEFQEYEKKFLELSGQCMGALKHVEKEGKTQLQIEILRDEALQTSEIEGELLDRDSVQSSIRRQFGLQVSKPNHLLKEKGISELIVSVYKDYERPLSHELITHWHYLLFQEQRSDAGNYRKHIAPMQVVSGSIDRPVVHFEAPPSAQVRAELDAFIEWYNEAHQEKSIPPLAIAAITHLWFESIHPFEDGNGRVGRALAEKSLSQSLKRPALISLSSVIQKKKKAYYDAFTYAQSGEDNEISSWMSYFQPLVLEAQERSLAVIEFLIQKSRLLHTHQNKLNERQEKVVLRMFDEGLDGFKGGLSASNYRAITQALSATATRDLIDLVAKGVLTKTGELKSTRYWLNLYDASLEN